MSTAFAIETREPKSHHGLSSNLLMFPCLPRGKAPWARFAAHGHLSAKLFEEWQGVPDEANWGIPCALNGLVVVDIDAGEIPIECTPTYTVKTSRGWHLYYISSPGVIYKGKMREGIDVKFNGYVIAPGSMHESGVGYEVIDARSPVPAQGMLERLIRK